MKFFKHAAILAVFLAIAFGATASATTIILNISSLQTTGTISASASQITFFPTTGNFNIGGGSDPYFVAGTGTVQSFANSTSASLALFLSLTNQPNFQLALSGADAAPSPFLGPIVALTPITPILTAASVGLSGTGSDLTHLYTWTGILSTQLIGSVSTIQQNGIYPTSWSGTITLTQTDRIPSVPEPDTYFTLGSALVGLGVIHFRRRKTSTTPAA